MRLASRVPRLEGVHRRDSKEIVMVNTGRLQIFATEAGLGFWSYQGEMLGIIQTVVLPDSDQSKPLYRSVIDLSF